MNTCLGALRKKQTREAREVDEETAHSPETTGRDADPEEEALGSERRSEMWAALRHVRAEHGAALILRHMEGLSYGEVAEVLGVPVGTAKGWTSRGRAAMLVALLKKTTAATERGGGRRQTPANLEETGRRSRRPEHAPRTSAHTSLVLARL